jgi:6-phosphogluconolactonase
LSALARIDIQPDAQTLAAHVADWFVDLVASTNDPFRVALAGGSTPRALYAELGSERCRGLVDWDRVEFFWGDERFVSATDPDSNYRMAHEALLSHIQVPAQNIHPIPTDGDPQDAAARYEAILKDAHESQTLDPARPLFDLVLLGLGSDGHTASLLPGSAVLEEKKRWAAAVTQGRPETRITLTYPVLESTRVAAFLVTGKDKAAAVHAVQAGEIALPASRLRPVGETVWFLDRAAAEF